MIQKRSVGELLGGTAPNKIIGGTCLLPRNLPVWSRWSSR